MCGASVPNTPTTETYTLSLHDALPISVLNELRRVRDSKSAAPPAPNGPLADVTRSLLTGQFVATRPEASGQEATNCPRSEEHTSELQSRFDLVCRLLLEKKKSRAPREH